LKNKRPAAVLKTRAEPRRTQIQMTQATRVLSTPPANTSARHSRRSILGATAGAPAGLLGTTFCRDR
jgi:hypothetical protein